MPKGAQRVHSTGKHRTSTSALTFSTPVQASSGLLEAQKGRSAGLSRPWPGSHSRRVAKRHQRGGEKSPVSIRSLARSSGAPLRTTLATPLAVDSALEGGTWASPGTPSPPFHLFLLCPHPVPREGARIPQHKCVCVCVCVCV